MTKQKLFDVDDKVTVFDQTGVITEVIDQTQEPHLYTVKFDATGNSYNIEVYHIKAQRDTRPVTERIKTFDDAKEWCLTNGQDKLVKEFDAYLLSDSTLEISTDILAYFKLRIITCALNEGWEPDFWNESEYKYWGWMYTLTEDEYNRLDEDEKKEHTYRFANGGLVYASAYGASSYTHANSGSRLAFKSRELAFYAVKQFKEIFAEYLF